MSIIEKTLTNNCSNNCRSLVVYLNCGDPSIEMTYKLIKQCAAHRVDVIELGVPFPNSFTDGGVVLRSHERALQNHVTFEDAILLVKKVRTECSIPIVLLVDFSHSIKSRGIKYVVEKSSLSGVDGLLFHGLPPLFLEDYIEQTNYYGIDPIFSLYPNTSPEKMALTLKNSKGFVYLVSQYGRTGSPVDFCSTEITAFFSSARQATKLPLMAGFGIKNLEDMKNIFSTNALDGVIVGSAICNIIEASLPSRKNIIKGIYNYLEMIATAKQFGYGEKIMTRVNHGTTS